MICGIAAYGMVLHIQYHNAMIYECTGSGESFVCLPACLPGQYCRVHLQAMQIQH